MVEGIVWALMAVWSLRFAWMVHQAIAFSRAGDAAETGKGGLYFAAHRYRRSAILWFSGTVILYLTHWIFYGSL